MAETFPEIRWRHGDEQCDCTFQRIGFWTNPYLARTLEVRLCCMWKKLDEMFPGMVRETPAFTNYNEGDRYVQEPALWNGEDDMPEALWHRQIAVLTGLSVKEVREKFIDQEPPKGWKHDITDPRNSDRLRKSGRTRLQLAGGQPADPGRKGSPQVSDHPRRKGGESRNVPARPRRRVNV